MIPGESARVLQGNMIAMRIVYWGTYEKGRERYRILMDGFRQSGMEILECHGDVWEGVRDKGMMSGWRSKSRIFVKYVLAYAKLIYRYLRLPHHDAVFVGYLGHFDVLILWPFAKLRRKPIVWDAILSIYIAFTSDRALVPPSHPLARLMFAVEWVSCHAADLVLLPSDARARHFSSRYHMRRGCAQSVFLGVEPERFPMRTKSWEEDSNTDPLTVLFYGQFMPLHGVETIIHAARMMKNDPIHWSLIGSGQVEEMVQKMLEEEPLPNLEWIRWVPYGELAGWIHRSDVALGIFGDSEKAATSIPNKVFQIISTGTPLITRDSPAIREIVNPKMPGVYLIPPNDPKSLVNAIQKVNTDRKGFSQLYLHSEITKCFQPEAIGKRIKYLICECLRNRSGVAQ